MNNSIFTLDELNNMNFNALCSERVGVVEHEDPEDFMENITNFQFQIQNIFSKMI